MTSVSQNIPNYVSGMSEQPDILKFPGQVKDIVNGIPDVTHGLYKRPGSVRIGTHPLANVQTGGSWFHYYRDETEGSYIGQIAADGSVRVWSCSTGTEMTVQYGTGGESTIKSYLATASSEDVQALTINDTTFLNNRSKVVTTTGTSTTKPDAYAAYIELLRSENGRQYALNLSTVGSTATTEISRATRLKITADNLYVGGGSGHCPGIGTQVFSGAETNKSGKKNLTYRLTILGQQGQFTETSSDDGSTRPDHYMCRYSKRVDLLHGGEGWTTGDTSTVTLTQTDGGGVVNYTDEKGRRDTSAAIYTITVTESETVTVKADIKAVRPAPTPFDADTAVGSDIILGGILSELGQLPGQTKLQSTNGKDITATVIGNGIYLSCASPFNVEVVETDLMRVMQDSINDVTELPNQCKDGYIVRVSNARISDEDDYYLKFVGDNGDGVGSWEECAAPGIATSFNASTMPHVLQRTATDTFTVKQFTYADRLVGDDTTNPFPTFADGESKINKVLFFRNRLAFLSGENVVLCKPGTLGKPDFFVETALTTSTVDPIDIACSSTFPSDLFDGIEINTGLLVFSSNQQFLLSSDDTVLNPDTAKLRSISTFNYNTVIPPISLGTSIGYIDNSNRYSRFNQMVAVTREGEPTVVEVSKLVPSLLPKNLDLITNSRENQIVLFGQTTSNIVYGLKYFADETQQRQTAWFKWRFDVGIKYHFIIDDQYYFLDIHNFLQKINIVKSLADSASGLNADFNYHLDNSTGLAFADGIFNTNTNETTFNLPWLNSLGYGVAKLAVVDKFTGRFSTGTVDGSTFTVAGDWSNIYTYKGYLYTYRVDLPHIYLNSTEGNRVKADSSSSLVIHRIHLNLGKIGSCDTVLTRLGKDPYTDKYESLQFDSYKPDSVPYLEEAMVTIPVYEKNTNVDISIKSTNPSPTTLHSMSWEGDYTSKYYKRV